MQKNSPSLNAMKTNRLTHSLCKFALLGLSFFPLVSLAVVEGGISSPAAAQANRRAAPAQPVVDAYTLGPGDRVRLDIFNVPEYSGEYTVLVDGTLNLPIIGTIVVRGATLTQASTAIANRYSPFIKRPVVTVGLLIPRPIQVAIAGEVNRAGAYTIPLTDGRKFPTLSQAVQLAGGASQTANLRQVRIQRGNRVGYVNLLDVLQRANVAQDITLRDGDTIFIPTANNVNAADIARTAGSNIGTQDSAIKIAIVGEVSRPGTYSMKAETPPNGGRISLPTITEAMKLAGGATASADVSGIRVKRVTKNGGYQVISINLLRLLDAGDMTQDLILQDGDTIYLPTDPVIGSAGSRRLATSSFGPQMLNPIKVAVVGQVNRPGTYTIKGEANTSNTSQLINLSPPTVTQAIQAAGGIKPTADVRQVVLQRFNRSGRGQAVKINLWDLLTRGDMSQDLVLQEGDRILIPEATVINPREVDTIANAPFAPGTIKVSVVGELNNQRGQRTTYSLDVTPNTTLNQAILAAGGFDPVRANKNTVDLIRLNPNGSVDKRTIAVDFAQGINEVNNPILRNNDVIVVGRSGTTRVGDTLGSVFNPLAPIFTILNLFR
jgi:polysaccharide biosynthesis/export protein